MFKRKQINKTTGAGASLALAVALATGAGMMGVAAPVAADLVSDPVSIAQDGLGDLLIFPYYTTRNGWATYFNITNTSGRTMVFKVRWHEGANSREVRDFNVFLSPRDVWTAAVVNTAEGARVVTSDNSCTAGKLSQDPTKDTLTTIDFTNLAYSGGNADGGDSSLDRTREGYFVVLGMGTAERETDGNSDNTILAEAAKHGAGTNNSAVPANCDWIRGRTTSQIEDELDEPESVLKGRAVLINNASGVAMGYDAVAFRNWRDIEQNYHPAASPLPHLNSGDDTPQSVALLREDGSANAAELLRLRLPSLFDGSGNVDRSSGEDLSNRPVDMLTNLMMTGAVVNDYNVATNSETDWVVTFPTKRWYVDNQDVFYAANPDNTVVERGFTEVASYSYAPFDNASVSGEVFDEGSNSGQSCFDVSLHMWDREEYAVTAAAAQFSPIAPGSTSQLCYEANILSFGDSDIFGSSLRKSVEAAPGDNGWAALTFGGGSAELPAVGMRMEVRRQGSAAANYGFANEHAYDVASREGLVGKSGLLGSLGILGGSGSVSP